MERGIEGSEAIANSAVPALLNVKVKGVECETTEVEGFHYSC
jgi:hypothetical protein